MLSFFAFNNKLFSFLVRAFYCFLSCQIQGKSVWYIKSAAAGQFDLTAIEQIGKKRVLIYGDYVWHSQKARRSVQGMHQSILPCAFAAFGVRLSWSQGAVCILWRSKKHCAQRTDQGHAEAVDEINRGEVFCCKPCPLIITAQIRNNDYTWSARVLFIACLYLGWICV